MTGQGPNMGGQQPGPPMGPPPMGGQQPGPPMGPPPMGGQQGPPMGPPPMGGQQQGMPMGPPPMGGQQPGPPMGPPPMGQQPMGPPPMVGQQQGPPMGPPPMGGQQGPPMGMQQPPPMGMQQPGPMGMQQPPPMNMQQPPPMGMQQPPPMGGQQGPPMNMQQQGPPMNQPPPSLPMPPGMMGMQQGPPPMGMQPGPPPPLRPPMSGNMPQPQMSMQPPTSMAQQAGSTPSMSEQNNVQPPNPDGPPGEDQSLPSLLTMHVEPPPGINMATPPENRDQKLPQALEKVLALKTQRASELGVDQEEDEDEEEDPGNQTRTPVILQSAFDDIENYEDDDDKQPKKPGRKDLKKRLKNKRKKKRNKKSKIKLQDQNDKNVDSKENSEDAAKGKEKEDIPEVEVEYIQEKLNLFELEPIYRSYARVLEAFRISEPTVVPDISKEIQAATIFGVQRKDLTKVPKLPEEDDIEEGGEGKGDEKPKLSKRKLKKLTRLSIAELKQLVSRPDVVEMHDVTARDPKLLVQLKAHRNTVPVPRHWCFKRKYLQGKRGIEKPPFDLPDFIKKTGIMEMRSSLQDKEEQKTLKAKMRERARPKMGKIDIDYQKLHDAFFKWQTKPRLTIHGDLYYEGKEYETRLKEKKPGDLSPELRQALGMPTGPNAHKVPPPWLIAMQRYGPPPSYPNLKIPGLNCPIPEGCSFGYHAGGWGKPPVDETGKPLYGDVFATNINVNEMKLDDDEVEKTTWGELESDSEEESEEEEEEGNNLTKIILIDKTVKDNHPEPESSSSSEEDSEEEENEGITSFNEVNVEPAVQKSEDPKEDSEDESEEESSLEESGNEDELKDDKNPLKIDITEMQNRIADLQRDISLKTSNIDRLQVELDAACNESEMVRRRFKRLEADLDLYKETNKELTERINVSASQVVEKEVKSSKQLEEAERRIKELEAELAQVKSEISSLQTSYKKLEADRDMEVQIIQKALEKALTDQEEMEAKYEKEFENLRTLNSSREVQMLEDFEWKLREVQKACKKKMQDLETVNDKKSSELAEKLAAAQADLEQISHLKLCEIELNQLKQTSSEQRKNLRLTNRKLEELQVSEKILQEEVHSLRASLDKEKNHVATLQALHREELIDKDRRAKLKLEVQVNQLTTEWEERLRRENFRVKTDTERSLREEKNAAVELVKKLKDQEISQLKQTWEKKSQDLKKEIENYKKKISEIEDSKRNDFDKIQTNADREIFDLRRKMDKLDMSYQEKIEKIQEQHEKELTAVREECDRRVQQSEANLQLQVGNSRTTIELVKQQLQNEAQLKLEHLEHEYQNKLQQQWERLNQEKEEALEKMEESHRQSLELLYSEMEKMKKQSKTDIEGKKKNQSPRMSSSQKKNSCSSDVSHSRNPISTRLDVAEVAEEIRTQGKEEVLQKSIEQLTKQLNAGKMEIEKLRQQLESRDSTKQQQRNPPQPLPNPRRNRKPRSGRN
ncbi:uncharacterized protein [Halyomorpha halys]|uniref:uncharacterized protein n=1 Tax=Halyomorpha halys TaxID=286706 RepID=UPI0006D51ABE